MHLLVFFSPLVESFIVFFRQLICRVVRIIPFVFHFSDLLSRSFRSRSFLFQKFEDKPCGDNAACGAAYYTPKNFVRGHFIKFVGDQIYLPRLAKINSHSARRACKDRSMMKSDNPNLITNYLHNERPIPRAEVTMVGLEVTQSSVYRLSFSYNTVYFLVMHLSAFLPKSSR